jgi:hypothetical protein
VTSLGLSLTDTLDDLINEGRIEPQLAMKILSTFDRVVTEVLADKVRARLTFKVSCLARDIRDQATKRPDLTKRPDPGSPGLLGIFE